MLPMERINAGMDFALPHTLELLGHLIQLRREATVVVILPL
jgi:hypothetical protein